MALRWRVQWPPDIPTCHLTLNGRCTSTSNVTGGSNPAPYKHSTKQTITKQHGTIHKLKTREATRSIQQCAEPQYNQLRRPGEPYGTNKYIPRTPSTTNEGDQADRNETTKSGALVLPIKVTKRTAQLKKKMRNQHHSATNQGDRGNHKR